MKELAKILVPDCMQAGKVKGVEGWKGRDQEESTRTLSVICCYCWKQICKLFKMFDEKTEVTFLEYLSKKLSE